MTARQRNVAGDTRAFCADWSLGNLNEHILPLLEHRGDVLAFPTLGVRGSIQQFAFVNQIANVEKCSTFGTNFDKRGLHAG